MKTQDIKPNIDRSKKLNSAPLVHVNFLLDVSDSMSWYNGINDLQDGMKVFMDTLIKDKYAASSAAIDIFTFNHKVEKIIDYQKADDIKMPKFVASGGTELEDAINKALDNVEEKYKEHHKQKQKVRISWVVLFTDADLNGENIDNKVVDRVNKMVKDKDILLFVIGAGNEVNIDELKRLNPKQPVIFSPTGESLKPLFQWISKSLSKYSKTAPGAKSKTEALDRRYELY